MVDAGENDVHRNQPIDLPSSYLEESAILRETQETILRLGELVAIFENLVEIRIRRGIELPFNPISVRRSLDRHDLRKLLARLNSLARELPRAERQDVRQLSSQVPHIAVVKSVKPILRGHLETTEISPIFDGAFLYISFIPIHKERDKLERDRHDFVGWHYHYCNAKGRRSDTMLSFDLHQPDRIDTNTGKPITRIDNTPLFWERHAETNAVFSSNADAWGNKKRLSILKAAQPDLTKKQFANFRHPEKLAKPVWPLGVTRSTPPKLR